jgi:hypothetical protein
MKIEMDADGMIFATNLHLFLFVSAYSDLRFALAAVQACSLCNALQRAQKMAIWTTIPVYKNPLIARRFAVRIP